MGWMDRWIDGWGSGEGDGRGGRAECVGVKGEHWKAPGKKNSKRIKKRQRQTEMLIGSIDWRIKI